MADERPTPDELQAEIMRLQAQLALPDVGPAIEFIRSLPGSEHGVLNRMLAHAYSLMRDAGIMDEAEALARIAFCLVHAAEEGHEAIHDAYNPRFEAIREAHGLEPDQFWARGEGPPEHEELNEEFEAGLDAHTEAVLRSLGGDELADFHEEDPQGFGELFEIGRRLCMGLGSDD